jgi:uncharacterized membrane protein YbhN (UPF0104 family)
MQGRNIKIIAGVIIFLLFVFFIEKYLGWLELLQPWSRLPVMAILVSVSVIFFSYWLRAFRLYDYFRDQKQVKISATYKIMLLHNFFNNFVPMRAGEASFPILMQRYFDISLVKSGPALLWFRILDLHTLLVLGLVVFGHYYFGLTVTILLAIPLLFVPVLLNTFGKALLILLHRRLDKKMFTRLVITVLENFPNDPSQFYRSWFWTVTNWLVKISVFSWVLIQFIDIEYINAWVGVIAGDLTSVLPVHGFAGAGTYEAGVVAALLPFGVDATSGLRGAVNLHLFMLGATILGALASLFIPTVKNSHSKTG